MLAEPLGELANRVNRKLDPIACYKNVAVGAFAVGGLLWLVVGGWALALSWLDAEPANALRAPTPTPPVLVGCMTLAVATILVGAVFWTAAAHREWVARFAAVAEGRWADRDDRLVELTELVKEQIEMVGRYTAVMEQRHELAAALPPEVADLTARLDRRLTPR